jgi:2-oxo-4-hydroxy-4-carboxy-5-ureidoimidazoline decarboxylase
MVMAALLAASLAAGESDGMSAAELARFNGLPAAAAREQLMACCSSPVWADRMAAGRPYSSARDAVRQSVAIVAMLTVPELEAALAGHPRIGEKPASPAHSADTAPAAGPAARAPAASTAAAASTEQSASTVRSAEWSRAEQSGVSAADAATRAALAEFNLEYERRFGHVYLVAASGRTGTELLTVLRARLRNSPLAEWRVVRAELQKINEIRLVKMLAGTR